ncbi:hypothetical protein DFH08DRAFT_938149 [Mycena albidolilacea]|uniref:F-box domain-containing protein n=1 Tax=Mycena albidolilacea TaxID=1033008 RepID=A0AAD6ZW70_9AGAR|nr:hypothetical protein DFH08DRAFT_938149 [Mycena albidolilacea]
MLSVLAADRSRLADINSRIADLERSLSELRNERVIVQGRLDEYKYPVITLPNEIVCEIFIHFLPVYPRPPPFTGTESPTNLARVCRHWREIALALPMLWRAIGVIQPHRMSYKRQNQMSEVWIKRSGACPLAINIAYYGGHDGSLSPEDVPAVIAQRPRWERLRIDALPHALTVIDGPMPRLRHLDLALCANGIPAPFEFQEVPLLRSVTLHGWVSSKAVTLPWGQLTCLTLLGIERSRCAAILQQTDSLIHCILEVVTSGPVDHPRLALPCLESLVVKERRGIEGDLKGFIHSFVVPALRSLELEEQLLGSGPVAALESFISQSGCTLQRVCITERTKPTKTYLLAFPHIPDFSFARVERR